MISTKVLGQAATLGLHRTDSLVPPPKATTSTVLACLPARQRLRPSRPTSRMRVSAPTPANVPPLNSATTTVTPVNASAMIAIVPKDSNGDGVIDILNSRKTGEICAPCHTISDNFLYSYRAAARFASSSTIAQTIRSISAASQRLASIHAATTSVLQLEPQQAAVIHWAAHRPASRRRPPTRMSMPTTTTTSSTSAGMFDDTVDGNGDPIHSAAPFRTKLAAPWGIHGSIVCLDNFSNLIYTTLLDPTTLTQANGHFNNRSVTRERW